jgi:hypothetical protein
MDYEYYTAVSEDVINHYDEDGGLLGSEYLELLLCLV